MADNKIVVIDAPSNLGLNPPESGTIPGCYKLPWALRDRNLLELINAIDSGSNAKEKLANYITVRMKTLNELTNFYDALKNIGYLPYFCLGHLLSKI